MADSGAIKLEANDIQGIILYGYGKLPAARFQLLKITDSAQARQWLGKLELARGNDTSTTPCINIAFTHAGFAELGLSADTLSLFSREFQEGMTTDHRQRLLGDLGENDPLKWRWGGSNGGAVHVLMMLYAPDFPSLDTWYSKQRKDWMAAGLVEVYTLDTVSLAGFKEHFGFHDGISEPVISGGHRDDGTKLGIAPGEFLLGYQNEYGEFTNSPSVPAALDPTSMLHPAKDDDSRRDIGRNGSYLVFRQLEQDVQGFWTFADNAAKDDGVSDPMERIRLASKMVGRWPSGASLVKSPMADPGDGVEPDNDFGFLTDDPNGYGCPFGSHVRRTNPRDSVTTDAKQSLDIANKHRIIRRGREYGEPIDAGMDTEKILQAPKDSGDRGLHFICFNANIGRQFEFIQHTWMNNPKLSGLYSDPDPIIGAPANPDGDPATFVIQADPVRRRVTGLPRFVTVRGGGYFFMPGISAVRYLASLTPDV